MTDTRKRRGADTQHIAARWFQARGWPFAESTGAGRTGSDLTGMPGLAPEIKARTGFSPLAWIRQARAGGTGLPFVILRCNGQGEAAAGEWPVMLRLEQFTTLLQAAGYGTPDLAQTGLKVAEAYCNGAVEIETWPGKPCKDCTGDSAVRKADGTLMTSPEWCESVNACGATIDWDRVFGHGDT